MELPQHMCCFLQKVNDYCVSQVTRKAYMVAHYFTKISKEPMEDKICFIRLPNDGTL